MCIHHAKHPGPVFKGFLSNLKAQQGGPGDRAQIWNSNNVSNSLV